MTDLTPERCPYCVSGRRCLLFLHEGHDHRYSTETTGVWATETASVVDPHEQLWKALAKERRENLSYKQTEPSFRAALNECCDILGMPGSPTLSTMPTVLRERLNVLTEQIERLSREAERSSDYWDQMCRLVRLIRDGKEDSPEADRVRDDLYKCAGACNSNERKLIGMLDTTLVYYQEISRNKIQTLTYTLYECGRIIGLDGDELLVDMPKHLGTYIARLQSDLKARETDLKNSEETLQTAVANFEMQEHVRTATLGQSQAVVKNAFGIEEKTEPKSIREILTQIADDSRIIREHLTRPQPVRHRR